MSTRPESEALDNDIAEELESHLAHAAADLAQAGLSLEAARLEARRRFGDLHIVHAAVRREDLWHRTVMQNLTIGLLALLLVGLAGLALHQSHAQTMEARQLAQVQHDLAILKGAEGRVPFLENIPLLKGAMVPDPDPNWTYRVGDRLKLADSSFPGRFADSDTITVEPDGRALFPQAGWLMVAGLQRAELESMLEAHYQEYWAEGADPRVLYVQD